MINLLLTVTGIVIGVLATTIVGRYFFRRTFERSLTPFIHLHSFVLAGIDPQVRGDLKILFHDQPIADLTHLQLLIANTGTRAIRDCIKPLTISFPKGTTILDHAIIHRNPKELELQLQKKTQSGEQDVESVEVTFPLLNRADFFLIKFLLKGALKPFDVECRIAVDDLPPKLNVEWLPPSATRKEAKKVDWAAFGVGLGILLGATSLAYLIFLLWHAQPTLFPFPWKTYEFSLLNLLAFLFMAALEVLFVVIGILFLTGIAFDEAFSRSKHRFLLPDSLQPSPRFHFMPGEIIVDGEEMKTSNKASHATSEPAPSAASSAREG